ncbi:hypothetical protein B0H14DRAFT_764638 [Mycena olivaceomarginata]|nr:hypothetical protein B0H14DRAFT_764638 [Mycena olivaceomarginata]
MHHRLALSRGIAQALLLLWDWGRRDGVARVRKRYMCASSSFDDVLDVDQSPLFSIFATPPRRRFVSGPILVRLVRALHLPLPRFPIPASWLQWICESYHSDGVPVFYDSLGYAGAACDEVIEHDGHERRTGARWGAGRDSAALLLYWCRRRLCGFWFGMGET